MTDGRRSGGSGNFGGLMLRQFLALLAIAFATLPAHAGLFSSGWEDDMDKVEVCFKPLETDSDVQFLEAKVQVDKSRPPPTVVQLSDDAFPTPGDVEIMRRATAKRQPCRDMVAAAFRKHHPYLASAVERRFFQNDVVFVELFKQRISYGNATRLIHEAFLEYESLRTRYDQARDEEQRRAFGDYMRRSQQQQPVIPFPNTSKATCRWVGSTLYCDSY